MTNPGYNLTFTNKDGYIHATVSGPNTVDNVKQYLEEVYQYCQSIKCTRLLIEEQLEGPRLDLIKVLEITTEGSTRILGYFQAIAYVDVNAQGDLMHFAENVAVNRALPLRVFATVAAAENWISQIS